MLYFDCQAKNRHTERVKKWEKIGWSLGTWKKVWVSSGSLEGLSVSIPGPLALEPNALPTELPNRLAYSLKDTLNSDLRSRRKT